ncbi:hypothetical protein Ae406Ps2_3945 [Pseudonocardia sp. Ae406_Ps2]|nr:hypothetical protein Ae331Ps2_2011c [Pseudonocardia sp. Ae331_Ps2]OLM03945.1 hypothetical protein Ae406Ps2_3945 [Pseudonocardia sp. Ae406_Ps2]OLM25492.1 hypothetical protein Ae706Ps2_3925 [Pseudonocardia sp. Ae706_Ps2]
MGLGGPGDLVVVGMTGQSGTVQDALFGDAVIVENAEHGPAATQDPREVARIVAGAQDPGFFVIERTGRVIQADPARPGCAEAVSRHDGDTVAQLLDSGHLKLGGNHHIHHAGQEGPARAVLVPKATRDMVTRWGHLRPVPDPRPAPEPKRATGQGASGVIWVDVVQPGKALVLLAGTSQGGTVLREAGRYRVENDHGALVGHASTYRAAGRLLARYYGHRPGPGPVEIEHEHRARPRR